MAINSLSHFEVEGGEMHLKIDISNHNVYHEMPETLVLQALEALFNCLDPETQEAWITVRHREITEEGRAEAIRILEGEAL